MVSISVRPPEIFPRLAYCGLLLQADTFVLGDTFQHSRQSLQSRYRIRGPEGPRWLTVPTVKKYRGGPLHLVQIAPVQPSWARQHLKSLQYCYGQAAYWEHYRPEIEKLLTTPHTMLSELSSATVRATARWLRASAEITMTSDTPGGPTTTEEVLKEVDADRLLTLEDSRENDLPSATRHNMEVGILQIRETTRRQAFGGFVADLSILDLVLNHGPEAREVLDSYIVFRSSIPEQSRGPF